MSQLLCRNDIQIDSSAVMEAGSVSGYLKLYRLSNKNQTKNKTKVN
jgi:hypothetical protein